jgi:adenosylcobinamide-phosphate synthase
MMEYLPVLVCILGLAMDALFGEPRRHPLIVFGNIASSVEQKFNYQNSKIIGTVWVFLLTIIPSYGLWALLDNLGNIYLESGLGVVILWVAIGWKSMKDHARAVLKPLAIGDLVGARQSLSMIVSRDTKHMDESKIAGSTLESILENGNDCLFASLFWFALLGPAGVVLHRLANTLDAMWGYRTERFEQFGWAAARFDDLLGWVPARLTALCYALSGSLISALKSWKAQTGRHKSINGGPVMASGAGALNIRIGGPVIYQGVLEEKPWLGEGRNAEIQDIERAIDLIERSVAVWTVVYVLVITLTRYLV